MDYNLLLAVQESNYVEVMYLTDQGADVNTKSANGFTPLNYASINGNSQIVDALIHIGADLNIANDNGETPLMSAVIHNKFNIMMKLIQAGADVNKVNYYNRNALILAIQNNNYRAMIVLIHSGTNLNLIDNNQLSARDYYINNFEIINQELFNNNPNLLNGQINDPFNTNLIANGIEFNNIVNII
jgi:ankyrin repeat protein